MSWSPDGRYLMTRNDNMASLVWVWDIEDLGLCSLVALREPIRSARWHPSCKSSPGPNSDSNGAPTQSLALATGGQRFYLWSPSGPSWHDVPVLEVRDVESGRRK